SVRVERGVERRPEVARELRGRIVFRFGEEISPLAVSFGLDAIDGFDGDLKRPGLTVAGRLPDIVHVATAATPLGIPSWRSTSAAMRLVVHMRPKAASQAVARAAGEAGLNRCASPMPPPARARARRAAGPRTRSAPSRRTRDRRPRRCR